MAFIAYGQNIVAGWCGVTPQTLAMWILRCNREPDKYDPYPEPDVIMESGSRRSRGWWGHRRREWAEYAHSQALKPGAQMVAMRKDRK